MKGLNSRLSSDYARTDTPTAKTKQFGPHSFEKNARYSHDMF